MDSFQTRSPTLILIQSTSGFLQGLSIVMFCSIWTFIFPNQNLCDNHGKQYHNCAHKKSPIHPIIKGVHFRNHSWLPSTLQISCSHLYWDWFLDKLLVCVQISKYQNNWKAVYITQISRGPTKHQKNPSKWKTGESWYAYHHKQISQGKSLKQKKKSTTNRNLKETHEQISQEIHEKSQTLL